MCVCVWAAGVLVAAVSASDADATWPHNALRYVVYAPGSRDHFLVDPLTGHVTVSESADWLTRRAPAGGGWQYEMVVTAEDGGCPVSLSVDARLNVTVLTASNATSSDATDALPVFAGLDSSVLVRAVGADEPPGHVVCRCAALGLAPLRYDWLNDSAALGFDVSGQLVTSADAQHYLQVGYCRLPAGVLVVHRFHAYKLPFLQILPTVAFLFFFRTGLFTDTAEHIRLLLPRQHATPARRWASAGLHDGAITCSQRRPSGGMEDGPVVAHR